MTDIDAIPTPAHDPVVVDTEVKSPGPDPDHSKRRNFRLWVRRITLALIVLLPLWFMAAGLGSRIGLWSWGFGLVTMTRDIGPILLIATLAMGVFLALLAVLIKPRKVGALVALFAILVPVIAFARLAAVQATVAELPFIHDITTDTQDPPSFGATIMAEREATVGVNTLDYAGKRDREGGKLVSALQTQAYPNIRTLVLGEEPAVAFVRAEAVARTQGWKIVEADAESGRIDATDTTFWYGFKDDIAIRLRPAQGGGTRVDVRSVSRVGGSDLGANAARIEGFLEAMKEG